MPDWQLPHALSQRADAVYKWIYSADLSQQQPPVAGPAEAPLELSVWDAALFFGVIILLGALLHSSRKAISELASASRQLLVCMTYVVCAYIVLTICFIKMPKTTVERYVMAVWTAVDNVAQYVGLKPILMQYLTGTPSPAAAAATESVK